jgi:hypothetical protein
MNRPFHGHGPQSKRPRIDEADPLAEIFSPISSWLTKLSYEDAKDFRGQMAKIVESTVPQEKLKNLPTNFREQLPGPLPASVTKRDLNALKTNSYFVCEKSDGERMMLFADKRRLFLVDRKYTFVEVIAPDLAQLLAPSGPTLLDSELLPDPIPHPVKTAVISSATDTTTTTSTVTNSGTTAPSVQLKLMLFDAIAYNGEIVGKLFLTKRMDKLHDILKLYESKFNSLAPHPISIKQKVFYPAISVGHLLGKIREERSGEFVYEGNKRNP